MSDHPALLACDMDGTLLPEQPDPTWPEACRRFHRMVAGRRGLRIAYITGRDLNRARQGILESGLPEPHWLGCDVGTAVYRRHGRRYHADRVYREHMRARLGRPDMRDIRRILSGHAGLTLQEDDRQTPFKCSYYLAPEDGPGILPQVRSSLARHDVRVRLVFSIDRAARKGLLDILPEGAAKDSALHFLRKKLGLEPSQVVYAGDSGNDLDAFLSGCRALLVSNTPATIKKQVQRVLQSKDAAAEVYIAQRPWLHGVLDGCRHFGL